MPDKSKIWDIFEYVLGLATVAGLFLFVYLNMSLALKDPDIWLHLKTGEYIVQHKTVPSIEIFSSTVAGKDWIDHSWLVQVIFYLVFRFAGPDGLIFLSAIIVVLAFLFLFLTAYRQRQFLTLSVAILFITICASQVRFNIRPENFSILFFSLYLFILTKLAHKKWVFLLPLIQLIWVNSHGFFVFGPLLVGIFILAERLKRTNLLPWEWGKTELLDRHTYRNLVRVFLLVCLVSFINPYGYKGALYPLGVTLSSIGKSSIFYKHIQELLPSWQNHNIFSAYYTLVLLSLLVFLLNFRRINIAYLMLWLISLGLSFRINRNIIFFNFIAFLTTTDGLSKGPPIKKFNFIDAFFGRSIYLLKYAIIIIIIIWVAKKDYSLLNSRYYIFEDNRFKSSLLGIAPKRYPDKAVDFLLENNLPDNTFNLFNYGSYLIYRLFPKKKVFIDGRTELYGDEFFKDYLKIYNVAGGTIKNIFDKYNINTVLLSGDASDIGNLSSYFFNSPDWTLVYFNENSLIFLKNTPQNKMFISRLSVDLKNWRPAKIDLDKIGIRNIFPDPYIRRARLLYYLGLYEQAIAEAKEALRILPSSAEAYNIIGRIYLKQKLYAPAFENIRLAYIYDPCGKDTLISLGKIYMETDKVKQAIKSYKILIKCNPRLAEGYYLLGLSYNKINEIKLTVKAFKTAIKLNPFNTRYYRDLGELLDKNNDFKGAAQIYKDAIGQGLDTEDFYKRLESVYNKTGVQK